MTSNDLGKFTVETCNQISILSVLKKIRKSLKESDVRIGNYEIQLTTSKTGGGGTRYWFKCPNCKRRVRDLYQHPVKNIVGCRKCLKISYYKTRYKGMLEEKLNDSYKDV